MERELIEAFAELTVATVGEALGGVGMMEPLVRPIVADRVVVGPAVTCRTTPGDNLPMHRALDAARPGDVVVVAAGGPATTGMFGGMAAHSAIALGLAGLVTDGSVRDVREIRRLGFGLWAGGVSPLGARKDVPGDLNVPVVCGGVLVRPGDLVIADDDGVAVVPAERAAEVLELALARERKEAALAELLDSGRSTLDALGFRDRVDELLART